MHLMPETTWLLVSAEMPAEDPFGRAMAEQPVLTAIESPMAPVLGLVASQLHRCVADEETLAL